LEGVSPPSRVGGLEERREFSSGIRAWPQTHFLQIIGHRTLIVKQCKLLIQQ